jgi:hypothetical protein
VPLRADDAGVAHKKEGCDYDYPQYQLVFPHEGPGIINIIERTRKSCLLGSDMLLITDGDNFCYF